MELPDAGVLTEASSDRGLGPVSPGLVMVATRS
jgi:hypothetical protein